MHKFTYEIRKVGSGESQMIDADIPADECSSQYARDNTPEGWLFWRLWETRHREPGELLDRIEHLEAMVMNLGRKVGILERHCEALRRRRP